MQDFSAREEEVAARLGRGSGAPVGGATGSPAFGKAKGEIQQAEQDPEATRVLCWRRVRGQKFCFVLVMS